MPTNLVAKLAASLIFLFLLSAAPCSQAQATFYVFNGNALKIADGTTAQASFLQWQVWLFQEGVHVNPGRAGLQYSRWGLIEGTSAANVLQQLNAFQKFEQAYLNFFGPNTWGRNTFSDPLGPIAVAGESNDIQPGVLEKRYQLAALTNRLSRLAAAVQPSLENDENHGTNSIKEDFDQIRDALQQVSKIRGHLARTAPQLHFIDREIVQTQAAVVRAERLVPDIISVLPTVKLPTDTSWMFQTENAGSDGTIEVIISETDSGVSVRQTWTGGDGSMTGTVFVTRIPYKDIGDIDFVPPVSHSDPGWGVRVYAGRDPFTQEINSPQRRGRRGVFPAVHRKVTEESVYFTFVNSADAQNAYAYFLYHKQLGR